MLLIAGFLLTVLIPIETLLVLFSRRAIMRLVPNCCSARIDIEQAALQEVYGDDVDLCDTLVGNLAEDKIEGFAIR